MLQPKKVINNNCDNISKCFKSIDDNLTSNLIDAITDSFELSPSYVEVTKNFVTTTKYKTWIYEGNKADKLIGYKYLLSYPYEEIQFRAGDFVTWNYGGNSNSNWLIESFNRQHYFEAKGKILECNNKIKYRLNGQIYEIPCVLLDNTSYTTFTNRGTDKIIESNAQIEVLTQQNTLTDYIKKNRRFIFNDLVYAVKQTVRSVNDNFLRVILYEVTEQKEDDFVNGVAWNGEDIPVVIVTQTKITPEIFEISEEDTQAYEVYEYIDGAKQPTTFTITTSEVPSDKYNLNIIDGNKFTIRCNISHSANPLMVACTNNTTSEVVSMNIWLTGGWI